MAHGEDLSRPGGGWGRLQAARVAAVPVERLRGAAVTSCFPALPRMLMLLMLLSGRRNRQWDRSP